MSNSLGLVDFAIGLVNSGLNLPDGQINFGEIHIQKNCNQSCSSKIFFRANQNDSWASTC